MQSKLLVPFATALVAHYSNALNLHLQIDGEVDEATKECQSAIWSVNHWKTVGCEENQECNDYRVQWLYDALPKCENDAEKQQCVADAVEFKHQKYHQCGEDEACKHKWWKVWLPSKIDECLFGEGGYNGGDGDSGDDKPEPTCEERVKAIAEKEKKACGELPEDQQDACENQVIEWLRNQLDECDGDKPEPTCEERVTAIAVKEKEACEELPEGEVGACKE